MKKLITLSLCLAAALLLTGCGSQESGEIADPFVEYDTIEEAEEAVGFDITVPDSIDGYSKRIIRVDSQDQLIEVIYQNEQNEDQEIRIRKAVGTDEISGDYNEYSQSRTLAIDNLEVTVKGDNDLITVATWAQDPYVYSIGNYSDSGFTEGELVKLIQEIH